MRVPSILATKNGGFSNDSSSSATSVVDKRDIRLQYRLETKFGEKKANLCIAVPMANKSTLILQKKT